MKDPKKQKGTKVKLTRGKRVSLRCPLAIDSTVLEHNYDAGTAQVCLTIENMGGGGTTDDTVESAIIVIRLFDEKGALVPCEKNEYFAKMLRFGEEGLQSGAQITFRLTPDCDGGLRVTELELYISRVRYADGTVTDYLRGDFFDLPGDAIPLQKRYKKELPSITEKFGVSAKYIPEELTEIIWRCTCGEFCESDQCSTCGTSKRDLFTYFGIPSQKKAGTAVTAAPAPADRSDQLGATDGSTSIGTTSFTPPTDATTEYDTGTFAAGVFSASDGDEEQTEPETLSHISAPAAKKKPDKLKITLIAAIVVSSALLIFIVVLLVMTLMARSKKPVETTPPANTTDSIITTLPPVSETPVSDNEKLVRTYLEQKEFDDALGYAKMSGCSDELIHEVLLAAVDYYTNVEPDSELAMQYAQELGDTTSIESITLQLYNDAIAAKDYTAAITYANNLTADKDAKLLEAANGLVAEQIAANDFEAAKKTAETYKTATTVEDISLAAVTYYTNSGDYDKALDLAQGVAPETQIVEIAKAAVNHYIQEQNYEKAADYVRLTGDSADILTLLPYFNESSIKKHLPTFFPYLTFEQQQAVHADVMSTADGIGIVDVYGNAHWGADQSQLAAVTGKTAVSIKCTNLTTVVLFSNGTVAAFGDNTYGQCNVGGWTNIVAIDASQYHTVGLKADGSVVAVGRTGEKQCDVGQYSNVVAIAAGGYHTMVLHRDGTVSSTGMTTSGQCNTSEWKDIVAISAGHLHSVGLKSDGTVVAAGSSNTGRCDVGEWRNVIQISAGESSTVGLTSEGRVLLASGDTNHGDVSSMTSVIWVSAGNNSVTALRSNGTIMTTGSATPDLTFALKQNIKTKIYGLQ